MANKRFNKLKENTKNETPKGALDIVDDSVSGYEADIEGKHEKENEDEKRYSRCYTLTKSQLKLLQMEKINQVDLSLSEIVGKAIEAYCKH